MYNPFAPDTGKQGELLAAGWYKKHGWQIVARNYRTRQGEIDLVAAKGDVLAFVEVKTRTGRMLSRPAEAVDRRKQRRVIAAAGLFLAAYDGPQQQIRFDVLEVYPEKRGEARFFCIEQAFEC